MAALRERYGAGQETCSNPMLNKWRHPCQPFPLLWRSLRIVPLLYGGVLLGAINSPVKIESGMVAGIPGSDLKVTQFLGIPFAAPPVGDLRWRPPQPPAPWQGVRKADRVSAGCMQFPAAEGPGVPWTREFNAHGSISEDCLYLNVWTPAASANEERPVLVWIHGGRYADGSTAIPIYSGKGLAKKGLVVVSVNYRLNVLGFLAHPELSKESGHAASGNYGFMDQQAALRWVQRNVAAFGGDPAKVTVAGQSAGAGSVHFLSVSPASKGLYRALIAESGSRVWSDPVTSGNPVICNNLADAEREGVRIAESLGARSLQELRAMTWQQLTAKDPLALRPTVDGWVIPEGFSATYSGGKQIDVPFLTGCTRDEHGASPHPKVDAAAYRKASRERFGEMTDAFLKLYPVASDADAPAALNATIRDYERTSMYLWARDRQKTSKTKVFTYYWTHAIPGPEKDIYGAFHCSEIPYVLNTLSGSDRPFQPIDHKIAEMMSSYWVNFVTTGDPNGGGLPAWAAFDPARPVTMELGERNGPIPVADPAKRQLLEEFFAKQRTVR